MKNEKIIACLKTASPYSFVSEFSDGRNELMSAKGYNDHKIKSLESILEENPDNETYKNDLKNQKKVNYELTNYEVFYKAQEKHYLDRPLRETTEDHFQEMLCCLPPFLWRRSNDFETFCISEMTCGDFTSQYARYKDKYYSKTVNCRDTRTWITIDMIEEYEEGKK